MAVITSGNHPKALWPGVAAWWGLSYKKHPMEWSEIFETKTSDKSYEEDVEATGFGLAPVKSEGSAVSYTAHTQGAVTRYTNVAYALGFIVTKEEMDDNQYEKLAKSRTESLAFSMRTTKEIVHANVLNRAFTAGYAGGDGQEMISANHPTNTGDQSNYLATPADLSEASLEDLLIMINTAKNTNGLQIALTGQKLIVPPQLVFDAERIVKSTLRSDSADNDVNALKSMGLLPGGVVVNHYLTDADAWFVKTDAPNGLTHYKRKAIEFTKDNDFDTENAKAKAYERYSAGWSDFRTIYGSEGAG
jgi:hypothetical protein